MEDNNWHLKPCKDLHGNISFGEMFRPVKSDEVIMDNYDYEWKQETAGGWIRVKDNFFIPMGPNGNFYQHKFHSVENQKLMRTYRENKLNKKVQNKSAKDTNTK
tara:strand:- start:158 stop:469 length:312 start_codon:yes stop_codon:yes gene_type:complete